MVLSVGEDAFDLHLRSESRNHTCARKQRICLGEAELFVVGVGGLAADGDAAKALSPLYAVRQQGTLYLHRSQVRGTGASRRPRPE